MRPIDCPLAGARRDVETGESGLVGICVHAIVSGNDLPSEIRTASAMGCCRAGGWTSIESSRTSAGDRSPRRPTGGVVGAHGLCTYSPGIKAGFT